MVLMLSGVGAVAAGCSSSGIAGAAAAGLLSSGGHASSLLRGGQNASPWVSSAPGSGAGSHTLCSVSSTTSSRGTTRVAAASGRARRLQRSVPCHGAGASSDAGLRHVTPCPASNKASGSHGCLQTRSNSHVTVFMVLQER